MRQQTTLREKWSLHHALWSVAPWGRHCGATNRSRHRGRLRCVHCVALAADVMDCCHGNHLDHRHEHHRGSGCGGARTSLGVAQNVLRRARVAMCHAQKLVVHVHAQWLRHVSDQRVLVLVLRRLRFRRLHLRLQVDQAPMILRLPLLRR